MFDSFNRQITYLRVSVTDRCNLRCLYCMPEKGIDLKKHSDILAYENIIEIVREAAVLGISKIRLTGGEPLVRKNIVYFVEQLRKVSGLEELNLTTNGILLAAMADSLKKAGLDRINISLDTLNPDKYRHITRWGNITDVRAGIQAAQKAGFKPIKINMVLLPGINDDEVDEMKNFCLQQGLKLQRINRYVLTKIEDSSHISQAERPLPCYRCNRLRLTADGRLKPCLFSDIEIPVDLTDIKGSLFKAVGLKPEKGSRCVSRQNWQIGG